MLTSASGNLLDAGVDALVNTVNTVGVMGKGIALQFRRAYPDMFKAYAAACKTGEVQLGRMHVWETGMLDGPRFIINFPTKGHWRARSRIGDIEAGLVDLVEVVRGREITSIAIPPLGCGNGGLDWADVEPRIVTAFAALPELDVRLYPPAPAPHASAMRNATPRPRMTVGRAALVTLIDRYSAVALDASPIEVQKLMYFMQVLGEPLNLQYARNLYGPYADNLRHVLDHVEGHFLVGYGDGSAKVLAADPIRVLPDAVDEARGVVRAHPRTSERIDQVFQAIEGFESMYGMELLATVHWVAHEEPSATDPTMAAKIVREWNQRKRSLFTEQHVETAWCALTERGLIAAQR
ncbi:Appr-1-p processing protein [Gordonia sp. TBRC 11910]|uniref:Appr-1-p processing protein n=1 Tax=Gordonia asplenii TaxID=2725283 RepID=A0A848KM82_9ACTN|nr:macro domain-containing protein [Gordonia asplenii]NMN99775.1 Appr-1-p processing protein [Gordonia asplenii]